MKNKLLAISMLAGVLTVAGSTQASSSFSDLPSGRLAPSTRTRSESPSSSTDIGSGFSSGSDGTPDSSQSLPSGRPAPSRRTREFSGE